jgi:RNA polymerase sigma-70 factor (ECF subfamily)
MRRFKVGLDQAAFEQLVREYASPAKAVAFQILGDWASAEDAVQETFVRLIKKREQYSASDAFSPWFYVILRNVCIDMLRKRQRDSDLARQVSETAENASVESESDHASLLGMLPFRERSVLELRVVHSLSFREIAVALDISDEAAKKRTQRGLRRLREALSRGGGVQLKAV